MTGERTVPLANLAVLFAGILMAAAPHAARLPLWATGLVLALLAWRSWIAFHDERLPRKWLLFLFVIAGVFAVHMTHRSLFGRDAGVTMLVLFLALKLLETRTDRDVIVVTFLCYFLALTSFFYSQTLATAGFTAITVIVLTAGLVGFNAPRRPWQRNFRTAGVLLAQGLPLALVLFVLFPRVSGPLWGLPEDAYSSMTGLAGTMSPGSISRLTQSDAIAFRVKFDNEPPAKARMYWRGPVLWDYDGRTWMPGPLWLDEPYQFDRRGEPVSYEVTLEPHNRSWLFGLELAARIPSNAEATSDYQILARQPVRTRTRYRMTSYPEYRATSGTSVTSLQLATALPPGFNPRTVALGRSWRTSTSSDRALVGRAIEFFQKQGFVYTLEPPIAGRHTADEFIFDSRRGFCEHFASAFVILMRAAGVPARIVTGYQGGQLNPVDGFYVVRQSDAHAWAEAWVAGEGWVRIDPTAAANPVRVESGIAAAIPDSAGRPLFMRPEFTWLANLRYNWEALGNYWNQWVLGYNPDRQRDFLSRLGMSTPSLENMVLTLFWGVIIALGLVMYAMLRRMRPVDPVVRAWTRFCTKLARAGTPRAPSEGPQAFAERAARAHPHAAEALRAIAAAYVELRYGRGAGSARRSDPDLIQLRRLVQRLDLRV